MLKSFLVLPIIALSLLLNYAGNLNDKHSQFHVEASYSSLKQKHDEVISLKAIEAARIAEEQKAVQQTAATVQAAGVAPATPQGDIASIIVKWANYFGADPNQLLRVARCESGFNLFAYNSSGATGLFQFMVSTFNTWYPRAGAGGDIHSAEDQARTAAYMFSRGESHQWVCT